MNYATKIKHQPGADIDFTSIASTLLPNGFRVIKKDAQSIELIGRGMSSTSENPIKGATRLLIFAEPGLLHLKANLGGVLFMSLFICFIPPILIIALSLFNPSDTGVINFIWVWFIMGPIISYLMRRRTVNALNGLLENIV